MQILICPKDRGTQYILHSSVPINVDLPEHLMVIDRRNKIEAMAMISPTVVLVGIFIYAFLAWSFWISLTDWNTIGKFGQFSGLHNYIELFSRDSLFLKALTQTFQLTLLFIVIALPLGTASAILLDQGVKGQTIFRTIYLIPLSFSFVASATMWNWMFLPQNGSINTLLRLMHLEQLTQPWLTSPKQALYAITLIYIWQFTGFSTLVYYAGISSVPEELLDAAQVDGVSTWQKYRHVVLPLQKPATLTVLFLLIMYALRVFDIIWLTTGGGPAYASEVLATYMYRVTFDYNRFAYGASISTVMFLLSFVLVLCPVLLQYSLRRKNKGAAS